MNAANAKSPAVEQVAPVDHDHKNLPSESSSPVDAQPDISTLVTVDEIENDKEGWFAYLRTRNFYIVLLLG